MKHLHRPRQIVRPPRHGHALARHVRILGKERGAPRPGIGSRVTQPPHLTHDQCSGALRTGFNGGQQREGVALLARNSGQLQEGIDLGVRQIEPGNHTVYLPSFPCAVASRCQHLARRVHDGRAHRDISGLVSLPALRPGHLPAGGEVGPGAHASTSSACSKPCCSSRICRNVPPLCNSSARSKCSGCAS